MKILLMTNSNPMAAIALYQRVMIDFYTGDMKEVGFFCPQAEATVMEKLPDHPVPFVVGFPRIVEVCGKRLPKYLEESKIFFYIGSIEPQYANLFDIVIGYKDTDVEEYRTSIPLLNYNQVDTVFEDYNSLLFFLHKFLKIHKRNNNNEK